MKLLLGFAGLATAQGLAISARNPMYHISGDHLDTNETLDSKPGTPRMSAWEGAPLVKGIESWRVALGDRLIKASKARDAMKKCGKFLSFGDYTWCMRAMPHENDPAFRNKYGGVREFVVDKLIKAPPANPDDFAGLSFGIRTSDGWSELMSSMFLVRTELFDCYYSGAKGPMAVDLHEGYSHDKPCMARGCYTASYKTYSVCNDDTTNSTSRFTAANNRTYEPLHEALKGRPKFSTFVKMDVEGSEWATLDRLLKSEEDMDRIRALDMEVHMNLDATPKGMLPVSQATAERNVEIMEKLARKFAVTGSSLETYAKGHLAKYRKKRARDPRYRPRHFHPPVAYTRDGLRLDQYTISFVNRKLI